MNPSPEILLVCTYTLNMVLRRSHLRDRLQSDELNIWRDLSYAVLHRNLWCASEIRMICAALEILSMTTGRKFFCCRL